MFLSARFFVNFARLCLLVLVVLAPAGPAAAHPAPFSYLDITIEDQRLRGEVTVHTIDLAHELQLDAPSNLLDSAVLTQQYSAIKQVLTPRIRLAGAGRAPMALTFTGIEPLVAEDAVRLHFTASEVVAPSLQVEAHLFDYDPGHQTFVNIYEDDALAQQFLFAADTPARTHYAGTAAGVFAVFSTFVPSGAHHVLIGPDHILFLIGLILLGGGLRRLALIVTAFTIGHSVTLALAALSIFAPPAWLIEPLIALSIVIVGLDNLMRGKGRDWRPLFALVFGLVHGFGFAFVLREFGLPDANLGWSLFAFNIGVELGQLAIVVPLALILAAIRRRSKAVANRIALLGSLAVIAAGAYWFVDRVLSMGSG